MLNIARNSYLRIVCILLAGIFLLSESFALSPHTKFSPIHQIVEKTEDGKAVIRDDDDKFHLWEDITVDAAADPMVKLPAFMNRVAFRSIASLIGQYLYLGISQHTLIADIKAHVDAAELNASKQHDTLLKSFALDEIIFNEEKKAFYLPIYRNGMMAFQYKFYLDGNQKTADMTIPLGKTKLIPDGVNLYVDVAGLSDWYTDPGPRKAAYSRLENSKEKPNSIQPYPSWAKKANSVYNVFLRRCIRPDSPVVDERTGKKRYGNFTDLKWKFEQIASMGFNIVLLMPLNDPATFDPDEEDSPYNILSAYSLDPRFIDVERIDTEESDRLNIGNSMQIEIPENKLMRHFAYLYNNPDKKPEDYSDVTLKLYMQEYADTRALRALRDAHPRYLSLINAVYRGLDNAYDQEWFIRASNGSIRNSSVYRILFEYVLYEQYVAKMQLTEAMRHGHDLGLYIGYDMPAFSSVVGVDSIHHLDILLKNKDGHLINAGPNPEAGEVWDILAMYDLEHLKDMNFQPLIDKWAYWMRDIGMDVFRGDAWHFFYSSEGEESYYWDDMARICRQNGILFFSETSGAMNQQAIVNPRAAVLGNVNICTPYTEITEEDRGRFTPEELKKRFTEHMVFTELMSSSDHDTERIPDRYGSMFGYKMPNKDMRPEERRTVASSIHTLFAMASGFWSVFQDDERLSTWKIKKDIVTPDTWEGGKDKLDGDIRNLLTRLNRIRKRSPWLIEPNNTIWYGLSRDKRGRIVSYNEAGALAFGRGSDNGKHILSIINLSGRLISGVAHLGLHALGIDISREFRLYDSFSDRILTFTPGKNVYADGSIYYELKPGESHIFEIEIDPDNLTEERQLYFRLYNSMDSFVSYDERGTPAVAAGFPDTKGEKGRDTMLAVLGITSSGNYPIARKLLLKWAGLVDTNRRDGYVMPGVLAGEETGEDDWHTTDAALWFIEAAADYVEKSGDTAFLDIEIEDVTVRNIMGNIINRYKLTNDRLKDEGISNENAIYMDKETGFIYSPSHTTWMDTKYTPRQGYAVEIQALWYNALKRMGTIDEGNKDSYSSLATRLRDNFERYFWNEEDGCLYDIVGVDKSGVPPSSTVKGREIRPNQVFAVHFGLLDDSDKIIKVLSCVRNKLLIPCALRSLEPGTDLPSAKYGPYYNHEDDQETRDSIYHNGTGWVWPYPFYWVEAVRHGLVSMDEARGRMVNDYTWMINHGFTNFRSLSELVDGGLAENHGTDCSPKGASEQAWSVAIAMWGLGELREEEFVFPGKGIGSPRRRFQEYIEDIALLSRMCVHYKNTFAGIIYGHYSLSWEDNAELVNSIIPHLDKINNIEISDPLKTVEDLEKSERVFKEMSAFITELLFLVDRYKPENTESIKAFLYSYKYFITHAILPALEHWIEIKKGEGQEDLVLDWRAESRVHSHETEFFRPWRNQYASEAFCCFIDELARKGRDEKVRILSYGCSTGEEAFTIAISLMERGVPPFNIEIVGVDSSQYVINKARRGRYGRAKMYKILYQQQLKGLKERYFHELPDRTFLVKDTVRDAVSFKVCDLTEEDMSLLGIFDGIMFFNVEQYLKETDREKAYAVLAGLSHEETLLVTDFKKYPLEEKKDSFVKYNKYCLFVRNPAAKTGFSLSHLNTIALDNYHSNRRAWDRVIQEKPRTPLPKKALRRDLIPEDYEPPKLCEFMGEEIEFSLAGAERLVALAREADDRSRARQLLIKTIVATLRGILDELLIVAKYMDGPSGVRPLETTDEKQITDRIALLKKIFERLTILEGSGAVDEEYIKMTFTDLDEYDMRAKPLLREYSARLSKLYPEGLAREDAQKDLHEAYALLMRYQILRFMLGRIILSEGMKPGFMLGFCIIPEVNDKVEKTKDGMEEENRKEGIKRSYKYISLRLADPNKKIRVKTDVRAVDIIVDELAKNAFANLPCDDTGKVQGEVAVEVEERDDWCSITISDTGNGMLQEEMKRLDDIVFSNRRERLVRMDKYLLEGGFGLGINKTIELVKFLQGSFAITSTPGEGTKVEVNIPADYPIKTKLKKQPLPLPRDEKAVEGVENARKEATRFSDRITLDDVKNKAPLIVALGTSWIKGYEKTADGKRGRYPQYADLNKLIKSLRGFCREHGMFFIDREDGELFGAIEEARKDHGDAKVVALAGYETAHGAQFASLRQDKNVLVAGVRPTYLTMDSYVRLVKMLRLSLEISEGKCDPVAIKRAHPELRFNMESPRFITFEPMAEPKDYDVLRDLYRAQVCA